MKSAERTGKTVEEAIEAAVTELGVDRSRTEIEILEEPAKGVFGLGGKEARVRVTAKAEAETEAEAEKPAGVLAEEDMAEAGQELQEILGLMGIEADVSARQEDEYIHLDIAGPDTGIIIGRHGQTLDSLQFILNLLHNKNRPERQRVIIDAEAYRERRKNTLAQMAERMADRAMVSGQEVVLSPMSPFERRVIHTTLQDHEGVDTLSEGEDPYRRVIIQPRR